MTPGKISKEVVSERVSLIQEMIEGIKELPSKNRQEFLGDKRNVAAAESYLRRSLEALLDLGRHILAKGFGYPTTEYDLQGSGIIS